MPPEKSFNASSRYGPVTRSAAFFPRRLDPVLNRRPRHENAVVTPQMPGTGAVGQTIFDDQTHRQVYHAARVVSVGVCQVGKIGVEILATPVTPISRILTYHIERM